MCIRDRDLRERMGEASRELAEAKFDEREVIRQTVEVYSRLSNKMPTVEHWTEESAVAVPALTEQVVYDTAIPIAS